MALKVKWMHDAKSQVNVRQTPEECVRRVRKERVRDGGGSDGGSDGKRI
ncbi:MAG: hypothetical protein N2V73_03715 [Candidatus Methanospirare jalkutatii]|nr:hypothetical protein [Candidatus Methanospirare jalkutatii]